MKTTDQNALHSTKEVNAGAAPFVFVSNTLFDTIKQTQRFDSI